MFRFEQPNHHEGRTTLAQLTTVKRGVHVAGAREPGPFGRSSWTALRLLLEGTTSYSVGEWSLSRVSLINASVWDFGGCHFVGSGKCLPPSPPLLFPPSPPVPQCALSPSLFPPLSLPSISPPISLSTQLVLLLQYTYTTRSHAYNSSHSKPWRR
jgi:hypothetical protein